MAWQDIQVRNWRGHAHVLKTDTNPDSCPICHHAVEPADTGWDFFIDIPNNQVIERVFRCPNKDCLRLFIARYRQNPTAANLFMLVGCVPTELLDLETTPELQKISPDFCAINNQAHKAEQLGLLLVCGPGYRKALEFLIKDYVSQAHPTEVKEIEEMPLMGCIKKYVTDARIKLTAERAAWLGNDETHFVRKWEDKDLQDLKKLIQLTCYWIQSEHLTNALVAEMPHGKK
jgi:hypothetical protein